MKTDKELFTIGASIQNGNPNPLTESEKLELQNAIDADKELIVKLSTRKISSRGFYDERQSQAQGTVNTINKIKSRINFLSFFLEN